MLPGTEALNMTFNGKDFSLGDCLAWTNLLCVADKLRLSTSALSFEVQGFEDEAAASSAVPSPRICTAARQLSAVVEDHMRPGDETAGMHSAQYSRQQQHRSAGSQRLSCVRNTGQHLRLNAAQSDQIMQRRHARTLFAAQHRYRLLLSTAAVCCSAHRIGHVSSGHTTLFDAPKPSAPEQHLIMQADACCYYACCGCHRCCGTAYAERASHNQATTHAAASAAGRAGDCSASRARSTTSGE